MSEAASAAALGGETTTTTTVATATETTAAATTPASAAASSTPWWESQSYSAEERNWLVSKGLTKPDIADVLPAVVKSARGAEQLIGKGRESFIERPAKDQPLPAYLKANASVLGLPEAADGYAVQPPADWPKGTAWDAELEAQARTVAFDNGVPKEAHEAYVALFAGKMKAMMGSAEADLSAAKAKMMTELETEWGAQTDARLNVARQAAQSFAAKAGLSPEALTALGSNLAKGVGDAAVIRMFAAIGAAMGEDGAVALNATGGALTMTPADARAEMVAFQAPGGDWYKAVQSNDRKRIAELKPRFEQLARIAAGGQQR